MLIVPGVVLPSNMLPPELTAYVKDGVNGTQILVIVNVCEMVSLQSGIVLLFAINITVFTPLEE